MKILLFFLFCSVINFNVYAQTENSETVINIDQLKETEFYSMQTKGWMLIKYEIGTQYLANLSNKNYTLYLYLNCKNDSQNPGYLIEFNNNYREGDWAGLDFASSKNENFTKVTLSVDGKEIENPFENKTKIAFKQFKTALKKGKVFGMKFYNDEFDFEKGKDTLTLNRELTFMLENSHLLETPTDCNEEDTTPIPTTTILSSGR